MSYNNFTPYVTDQVLLSAEEREIESFRERMKENEKSGKLHETPHDSTSKSKLAERRVK